MSAYPNVGDVVTVLAWGGKHSGDRSWVGQRLDVLAVDAPFVVARDSCGCVVSLDVRIVTLMRLSAEAAEALLPARHRVPNAFAGLCGGYTCVVPEVTR